MNMLRYVNVLSIILMSPTLMQAANVDELVVDLDIFNGQGAETEVAESLEDTRGAFTAANKNDTDANGTIDNAQPTVTGEVDLMQMILRKPSRQPGSDPVTLTLISGNAKVYRSSTKGTEELMPRDYNYSDLPLTLWVEAVETSSSVRDIEFKMEYYGASDSIKATGIWAVFKNAKNALADTPWPTMGNPALNNFNTVLHGKFGILNWPNPIEFQNGIGLEFQVYPANVGNEPPVRFDVTRQIEYRDWSTDSVTGAPC